MNSKPASQEQISKVGLELYRAQLLDNMSVQPGDSRGVRLDHFTAQVSAAYEMRKSISGLADELESELHSWDFSGDCSLHSDSTQVAYTLAPHFLVGVSSSRIEDMHVGALVTVTILAAVDDAPHGDPCRQRAALDELRDILASEFGAQEFEEPNLDWGTVTMFAPNADINEVSKWPAHLRELGWDVDASGDHMDEG